MKLYFALMVKFQDLNSLKQFQCNRSSINPWSLFPKTSDPLALFQRSATLTPLGRLICSLYFSDFFKPYIMDSHYFVIYTIYSHKNIYFLKVLQIKYF